jgi:hypothetical protein
MNTQTNPHENREPFPTGMLLGYGLAGVSLLVFAFLDLVSYQHYESLAVFLRPWTTDATYLLILAASLFAAIMGLLFAHQFQRGEPPRQIWLYFSLGYVFWVAGEIGGFVNRAIYEEIPSLTFNAVFWLSGYLCFAVALFLQYRLIYGRGRRISRYYLVAILIIALGISALISWLVLQANRESHENWLAVYVNILYPVSDIILGLAALWLMLLFSRGNWGRPWWGLIAFFFADGIYTWYNLGGAEHLTPVADTWLSVFTDVCYIGGYLIVGLAFLSLCLSQRQPASAPGQLPAKSNQTSKQAAVLSVKHRKTILWTAVGICLTLLGVFGWIYHFRPFPESDWNDGIVFLIIILGALAGAICGTLLTLQFQKGEPPRRIWLAFTLGWWAWALGEISDLIYSFFYEHYPEFTLSDICWIAGYFFFGLSVYYQFRLLARLRGRPTNLPYVLIVVAIPIITVGLTQLAVWRGLGEEWSWFGVYLAIFYPVCDLLQGAAALGFSLIFRGGRLGRPWWALICFAVADAITTWLWIGGGANLPETTRNLLYLFSDSVYLGGYFLVAVAFLSLYLLQRSIVYENPS